MTDKQPEALRLADLIDNRHCTYGDIDEAADELRRLHEVNAELVEALELMLKQFTKTPSTLKDTEVRGKAHAAIAKATGDEP